MLGLTLYFEGFHLLLLIDGALLTNILVLMIPNALYIHQCNYGYLKTHEGAGNYFFGMALFYLSIFNLIYFSFRVIQQAMGDVGS